MVSNSAGTSSLSASATARGARGAGVTIVAQIVAIFLHVVGTIIMARLLSPDAFGLLAMITVLMGIGLLIRDFGMGTAALQEAKLSQAQASNLFWINAALSGGSAIVLAASAPLVALMFGDERLVALVPVMAIVLLITGLQTQYQIRLAREMRFIAVAVTSVTSVIAGLTAGIFTALLGWGAWALVAQQGATALWVLTAYIVRTRWIPSLPSRGAGSRKHFRNGMNYGLANMLGYAADNADTFVIGLRWDTVALGYYNQAFRLFMQPMTRMFAPLSRVIIPTINHAGSEGRNKNSLLLRVQSAIVGLAVWALLALAVTADWLIPLLLGDQWLPVAPLLQILAIGGAFKSLSQINYWAYIIEQQSKYLLLSNLVTKPIQILLIVCAAFMGGLEWVAWAYVLGRAFAWPFNLVWLSRTTGQRSLTALGNGARILIAAGVSFALTTVLLSALPEMADIWMVVVGMVCSTIIYFALFAVSPGGVREARAILGLRRVIRRR